MTIDAPEIVGHTWTLRQLLTGRRYGVEPYQRAYAWTTTHVEDLVNDLAGRYLDQHRPEHGLSDIAGYRPYFLGTIVTSRGDGISYLVDGQQRMTTLTLLLIHLHRLQLRRGDAPSVLPLITSRFFGEEPANFQLSHGARAMDLLLRGGVADLPGDLSPADLVLVQRYRDIAEVFPPALADEYLPGLVEWLLHRVMLAEVETRDPELARAIFESTNDRGSRLTGADLIRAFVLDNVAPIDAEEVDRACRARLAALAELDPNAPAAFLRTWLLAKYARDAEDDASIGTSPHRWLVARAGALGLRDPADFRDLVLRDLDRLGARYGELRRAARVLTAGLEAVHYNAYNHLTVQYPLILAAVGPDDDDDAFRAKAGLIAEALDIFVARSMIAGTDHGAVTLRQRILDLARELRGLDVDKLAARLGETLLVDEYPPAGIEHFGLTPRNGAQVRYLLARISAWLDRRCGLDTDFGTYTSAAEPFGLEHVLANRPELRPELAPQRFAELRDRFGALLLLPRDLLASHGGMSYLRKLERYKTQNMLARSLHPAAYQDTPGLAALIEQAGVPFAPVRLDFDEAAVQRRQQVYQRLVELVWDASAYPVAPVRNRPAGGPETPVVSGPVVPAAAVLPTVPSG